MINEIIQIGKGILEAAESLGEADVICQELSQSEILAETAGAIENSRLETLCENARNWVDSIFSREKPEVPSAACSVEEFGETLEAKRRLNEISGWIGEVNPGYQPWRPDHWASNNCGACAFSVEQRLSHADPDALAGIVNIGKDSEMEALTGLRCKYMRPENIERILKQRGPGSHLIVGINRHFSPGHWFNTYFDGEKIHVLDGQTGEIMDWPHDYGDIRAYCAMI